MINADPAELQIPDIISDETGEYLNSLFSSQYQRELDWDENVLRTLPLAVAGMALAGTGAGYVTIESSGVPIIARWVALISLGCTAITIILALVLLWRIVRVRTFFMLPFPTSMNAFRDELDRHYAALTPPQRDAAVVRTLRGHVLAQYAHCYEIAQPINQMKAVLRSYLLQTVIVAISLSFLSVVSIFVGKAWSSALISETVIFTMRLR